MSAQIPVSALPFPNTVATGAAVATGSIENVTMQFTFGDFVGVVMPQASYDGLGNFVDLVAGGVNATCAVVVLGRPFAVRAKTTTATSGSTQTASVSGDPASS